MYSYIVYWIFVNPLNMLQICATPARSYGEAIQIANEYRRNDIPVNIQPILRR